MVIFFYKWANALVPPTRLLGVEEGKHMTLTGVLTINGSWWHLVDHIVAIPQEI